MAGLNLMDMIASAAGGQLAGQAGSQFGLDSNQSQGAIAALMPAISAALKRNTASENGLAGLLGALQNGGHSQYIEQPEVFAQPNTVQDGNAILGHLFGSKDVSRAVAGAAAKKTGIDSSILKKMLPLVATMAMGSLSKQTSGSSSIKSALAGMAVNHVLGGNKAGGVAGLISGLLGGGKAKAQQQQSSGAASLFGNLLDAGGDQDDGIMDDVLSMAMKQFLK